MTKVIMTGRKVPMKPAASCSLFILMFGICSFFIIQERSLLIQPQMRFAKKEKKKFMNNTREVRSGKKKGDYSSSLLSSSASISLL